MRSGVQWSLAAITLASALCLARQGHAAECPASRGFILRVTVVHGPVRRDYTVPAARMAQLAGEPISAATRLWRQSAALGAEPVETQHTTRNPTMDGLLALSRQLFSVINASDHPGRLVFLMAEGAAKWLVFAAMLLLACLWIWRPLSRRAAILTTALAAAIGLGLNWSVGLLWYEPRPFMAHVGHTLVTHAADNAFPSNHATFMWSLGFGLILTGASPAWGWVVSLLTLVVAWARIYLGLHWPIDMAGSLVVSVAAASLARVMLQPVRHYVLPDVNAIYEAALRGLHLPVAIFPRGRE